MDTQCGTDRAHNSDSSICKGTHLVVGAGHTSAKGGVTSQEPQEILVSDASKMVWGAYLESGREINEEWSEREKGRHINWL